jgi:radical SAM superfamily enzyme YgiQ (UPF0313 family)
METKNIYMIQPNYLYGKSAHLPYASGAIAAYSFKNDTVKSAYSLKKIQFLRDDINSTVREAQNPFIIGFSTYVWNFEYNKALAKAFKDTFPGCIIVFGGHHVPPDGDLLREYSYIDILVHGEGEEPFTQILLSFLGKGVLEDIPNISFRKDGSFVNTPIKEYFGCDYPSPYLEGYFDTYFDEYSDLKFELMFETNRGCAYNCSYCDWGSLGKKIRRFPLERIYGEFEWACRHKIEFFGCADANFGILARDEEIIDKLIEMKEKTGYPKKFQTSYAKNNSDRIFNIGKKLNDNNMNKGVTLAFQTISPYASKNVNRTNVSIQHYTTLMSLYNAANIPTYTELILGLPGETYESFADGMNELIKAGQHHSIYVHNCEWLPCSAMGSKEYIEKFDVGTTLVPLNEPHKEAPKGEEIPEYSRIVTQTYSMDRNMWVEANMLSYIVQCFHHMNLLQFFAIYLYSEHGVEYLDFYERLLRFSDNNPDTVCGKVFAEVRRRLHAVLKGTGSLLCYDTMFGDVGWPFEEYAFLKIVVNLDVFYDEIKVFLETFPLPSHMLDDLLVYQRNIIKRPSKVDTEYKLNHNFHEYFTGKFRSIDSNLSPCKATVIITNGELFSSWADYARKVVWYGRKESKNLCRVTVLAEEPAHE